MKLIKLGAIDSTNEFLKGLSNRQELDNFTVVIAEKQTKGKGQMGSVWDSEEGKNLILSVFIKDPLLNVNHIYNLNIAVAVSVVNVLESYNIPELSIKWPNDIMSYNFKIGGILIENSLKSDGAVSSVVGLGLNINQTNFENLPKASSLAVICKSQFDKEQLLFDIIEKMKQNIVLVQKQPEALWIKYTERLFKKGVPMPFKDNYDKKFMGIIQGVSAIGKLQVLLEDDSICEYGIKEIQILY
ncbi:biotin--[acetyl-CoA-carboxylase] ligase [Flavobacterium sp. Arc3]|jgi:BirA family biotin operon repressor/biotin-[acetyl-CoA-carboxylase] ligase|uniref:biotin--[acetyl-CoA-carboxylase] ligase n=1 Tax=unclassified Flavobacterium TaxID=196869 RepID=UPI00352CA67D